MNREFDLPMGVPREPARHKLHCLAPGCEYVATARNAGTALRRIRKHRSDKHLDMKGKPHR